MRALKFSKQFLFISSFITIINISCAKKTTTISPEADTKKITEEKKNPNFDTVQKQKYLHNVTVQQKKENSPSELCTIVGETKDSLIVGDFQSKGFSVVFQNDTIALVADHFEEVLFYKIAGKEIVSDKKYKYEIKHSAEEESFIVEVSLFNKSEDIWLINNELDYVPNFLFHIGFRSLKKEMVTNINKGNSAYEDNRDQVPYYYKIKSHIKNGPSICSGCNILLNKEYKTLKGDSIIIKNKSVFSTKDNKEYSLKGIIKKEDVYIVALDLVPDEQRGENILMLEDKLVFLKENNGDWRVWESVETSGFFPDHKYFVDTPSGLNIRSKPKLDARKTRKLNAYERVKILDTVSPIIIDEINGYWIQVEDIYKSKGYVFSGYIFPINKNL